jgi:hypothetical protein
MAITNEPLHEIFLVSQHLTNMAVVPKYEAMPMKLNQIMSQVISSDEYLNDDDDDDNNNNNNINNKPYV